MANNAQHKDDLSIFLSEFEDLLKQSKDSGVIERGSNYTIDSKLKVGANTKAAAKDAAATGLLDLFSRVANDKTLINDIINTATKSGGKMRDIKNVS